MSPTSPPKGHPLLALAPAARRELARTLVTGLAEAEEAHRELRIRSGLAGGVFYGLVGTISFAAWHVATGGAALPFLAFYGLWGGVQGAFSASLERAGLMPPLLPLALAIDAPRAAAAGLWAALHQRRHAPERLVLAAGVLVATRRAISYHLLVRLYGHAFPQVEVEEAVALLVRQGFVAESAPLAEPGEPMLLALTQTGFQLLKSLGVSAPTPRERRDPPIAPGVFPLFAALDARELPGRRAPREAEPALPREPEPAHVELPAWSVAAPAAAGVETPGPSAEADELAEEALAAEGSHAPARRKAWRGPLRLGLRRLTSVRLRGSVAAGTLAVVLALVGLAITIKPAAFDGLSQHEDVAARAAYMPGPSRGIALQFNGRGKLLSSYGGGLFLSIPDRLDFKKPLSFQDFDMASDCGLISREVQRAAISPTGRFLWCEMGGLPGLGPRERCLADLETRTVTHDLVAYNPTYGLPGMLGWAGPQTLLMSEASQPHEGSHWWLVDVTTHRPTPLAPPAHAIVMPLATADGVTMLAGCDAPKAGSWNMTLYRLDPTSHRYVPGLRTRMVLPDGLTETEPRSAAISPDNRYMLIALKPTGLDLPAQTGTLVVVALKDGTTAPVATSVSPLADQPMFWAPEVLNGHYRFYYNGGGPDGVVPCTGEVTPS